jgi:hypothetical protein
MVVWERNCVCVTDCTLQLRVSLHYKGRRVLSSPGSIPFELQTG